MPRNSGAGNPFATIEIKPFSPGPFACYSPAMTWLPFEPDTILASDVLPSPNHGERAGNRAPDMIVLHYTGMEDADTALQRLCAIESGVSAHYFVHEDGRIIQMVPEERRAWHAGHSFWAGETDINSCSIGIEIHNPGHDFGYPDFSRKQIAAVISLCRAIMLRQTIPADRVLAHSDVAPERKQDPGEKFPWRLLSESGIAHWVHPAPIMDSPSFEMGDRGEAIAKLQTALARYGYGLPTDGYYDEKTRCVVAAFQRHFRPSRIDGVLDSSTLITLRALLETQSSPPVTAQTPETMAEDAAGESMSDT
jgi:N-acetylmuramoyl-L-alanine amidase